MKQNWFRFVRGGRCYDFTAYTNQRTGEVIIRPRHNSKGKGIKTLPMQLIRSRWGQSVNAYQELAPFLEGTFTGEDTDRNPFNVFMQLNVGQGEVYLTKEEAAQGVCVLEDFVIASGKLYQLYVTEIGDQLVSNIRLYGLTEITEETTVAEFSAAVVGSRREMMCGVPRNPNAVRENLDVFVDLDELYFWRVYQVEDRGALRLEVVRTSVQIDCTDRQSKLREVVGTDGFTVTHATIGGQEGYYLSCPKMQNTGVAYMHARGPHGKPVHTSFTQLQSLSTYKEAYATVEAQAKAVNSYGGVNRVNYARPTPNQNYFLDWLQSGGVAPVPAPVQGTGNGGETAQFTISAVVSPAGSGVVNIAPAQPVASGTQVTLTAVANSGKRFVRWSDGSTQNPLTVTATASRSYTAEFENTTSNPPAGGDGEDGFSR